MTPRPSRAARSSRITRSGNLGAAIALINGKQVKALAPVEGRSPLMPDLPPHEFGTDG